MIREMQMTTDYPDIRAKRWVHLKLYKMTLFQRVLAMISQGNVLLA